MTERLHPSRLTHLAAQVRVPAYDRAARGIGIVHLGAGAFHRAHQAVYFDDLMQRSGGDWRILGVSCRGPNVRDQLAPQDCLYTVHEYSGAQTAVRLIGSIAQVRVGAENPAAVIDALAAASTRLICLTITEKGYCRAVSGRGLDLEHPDIVHDLSDPARARSAIGLLAEGLRERRRRQIAPVTIISCDNLPGNGVLLRQVLLDYAQARDSSLAHWIESEIACPACMVDRIVPATTDADIAAGAATVGLIDEALVKTEPFCQWIIEDRLSEGAPDLRLAGAHLVPDVRPFETAKLRLLNGSHSTLAYLGTVSGLTFVHEAIAEPEFLALIRHLMRSELAPTLDATADLDLQRYQSALIARFANSALQHRLQQIAMDGSQKLPLRLLRPLRWRIERGLPFDALALAVAAWMRYMLGRTEQGAAYRIDDPLAARLGHIVGATQRSAADLAGELLSLREIFDADLRHHPRFVDAVTRELELLLTQGARAAARRFLKTP
jgi:fructuronate reductase